MSLVATFGIGVAANVGYGATYRAFSGESPSWRATGSDALWGGAGGAGGAGLSRLGQAVMKTRAAQHAEAAAGAWLTKNIAGPLETAARHLFKCGSVSGAATAQSGFSRFVVGSEGATTLRFQAKGQQFGATPMLRKRHFSSHRFHTFMKGLGRMGTTVPLRSCS